MTHHHQQREKILQSCYHKFYLPTAFHSVFQLLAQTATFAFTGESGYTLGFRRKIAHSGLHAETGGISDGALSLPSTRTARSRTSPGRVPERRALPLLGLGRGCSQRTKRTCGTAMRLCASLSRRRRGPAGLRDLFTFVDVAACTPCAQGLSACARRGVVSPLLVCSACC